MDIALILVWDCIILRVLSFYFVHYSVVEFQWSFAGVLIPLTIGFNQSHGSSLRQVSTAITIGDESVGRKHAVLCCHGDGKAHVSGRCANSGKCKDIFFLK